MKHGLDDQDRELAIDEMEKAISLIGGLKDATEAIGFSQKSVYRWRESGVIAPLAAQRLHECTDQYIQRSRMRPDLWPDDGDQVDLSEVPTDELELELRRRKMDLDEIVA